MTGNVGFSGAATLTINGGLNGNIDFKNTASTINLAMGQNITITGAVGSTGRVNGDLILGGDNTEVTGAISNLAQITFNGPSNTILDSSAEATNFIINTTGNITVEGTTTGNITYMLGGVALLLTEILLIMLILTTKIMRL
ncbi:MAG: hypothetical protein RCG15_02885 [Candidatus Rickettsia vulgarisii]